MPFDPSTAEPVGDILRVPEDKGMRDTLVNIGTGTPPEKPHWNGKPSEWKQPLPVMGKAAKFDPESAEPVKADEPETALITPKGGLGAHVVGIADMILGFPEFVARSIVEGTTAGGLAIAGEEKPLQKAQEIVTEAEKAPWMQFLGHPVEKLTGVSSRGGVMEKVGEFIENKAVGPLAKAAGNGEGGAAVRMLADAGMSLLGLRGGQLARKLLNRGKKASEVKPQDPTTPSAEAILEEIRGEPAKPETTSPVQIARNLDAVRKAEQQAYELMREGASTKKVEALVKQNPELAAAMERIRLQRADAAAAFDKDFGARQGEVLPPEEISPENGKPNGLLEKQPVQKTSPELPDSTSVKPRLIEQAGRADPHLLAGMAGAGLGLMFAGDEKIRGALLGGLASYFLAGRVFRQKPTETLRVDPVSEETFKAKAKEIYEKHGEEKARQFVEARLEAKEAAEGVGHVQWLVGQSINETMSRARDVDNYVRKLSRVVKDPKEMEAVAEALDTNRIGDLPEQLRGAAESLKERFADIGKRGLEAGVLRALRENYISHIVDWKTSGKTLTAEWLDTFLGGLDKKGSNTTSRFGKARHYETFAELEQALKDSGLALKTKSAGEIYKLYASSLEKAIITKNLVNNLKNLRLEGGKKLMQQVTEKIPVPRGWETMNAPGLRNWAVDPELAPHLKFVLEAPNPSTALKAVHGLAQAVKRVNVIGSLFHAKSLAEAALLSLGPVEIAKGWLGVRPGMNAALKKLREGGLGDAIDKNIKAGMTTSVPEEISRGIFEMTGKTADALLAKFGLKTELGAKAGRAIEAVVLKPFDQFTWDYLHAGLKPYVMETLLDKARRNHPGVAEDALRRELAPFVNSVFGGQNWYELATKFQSEFLRNLALESLSPKGRMAGQALLFAMDWTTSAWRTLSMAAGKGTGPKGLIKPLKSADYARQYQLRNAIMYLTLVNAINMQTSGHSIFENKDWTRIEMADGTSIQPMKHAAEPFHWLTDPIGTLRNKLSFPAKALTQLLPAYKKGAREATEQEKIGALVQDVLPFQVSAATNAPEGRKLLSAVSGTLGVPVYGTPKTPAQMQARERLRAREERKRELRRRKEAE